MGRKLSPEEAAALGVSFTPKEMRASIDKIPDTETPPPERSFGGKVVDTISDALPVTGALAGGAIGATTGPFAPAMIPLGGAGLYSGGEFLKRLLDKVSGRPGTPPPVNVPASMAEGAKQSMNAASAGAVLGAAAGGLKDAGSIASKYAGQPTEYAGLSGTMFEKLLKKLGYAPLPGGPQPNVVAAVPRTAAERLGAQYATPAVDAARGRGVEMLKGLGTNAAEDAALFRKGEAAARLIPRVEGVMRGNVPKLARASGDAIDTIANTLPPRPDIKTVPTSSLDDVVGMPSKSQLDSGRLGRVNAAVKSGTELPPIRVVTNEHGDRIVEDGQHRLTVARQQGIPEIRAQFRAPMQSEYPTLPPGGDVVNQAFNSPGGQNSIIRDPEAMGKLADVKSLGLQNRVGGQVLGKAHFDLFNAERAGLTPKLAAEAENDAGTLLGQANSLQKQRGGVVQGRPGLLNTAIRKAGEIAHGPERTMFGLRPETPEQAILSGTRRQAEIEAARRGVDVPWTGQSAYDPQIRPLLQAIASPGGSALTGAQFELLRQMLMGEKK